MADPALEEAARIAAAMAGVSGEVEVSRLDPAMLLPPRRALTLEVATSMYAVGAIDFWTLLEVSNLHVPRGAVRWGPGVAIPYSP